MYKLDKSKFDPLARPAAVVQGEKYRITVLSAALLRFEYSEAGKFQDAVTTMVINRKFPEVEYQSFERDGFLYIETSRLQLKYDMKKPSPYGLQIRVLDSAIVWHFGDENSEFYQLSNLGGTARTLDQVDGSTDIGQGLLSRAGYVVVDNSDSSLINAEGWFEARQQSVDNEALKTKDGDENHPNLGTANAANTVNTEKPLDFYFFGHGLNYQEAIDDFYQLAGPVPLLPRFVFGNWWSRFYKYTDTEYKELIERFAQEEIPFSVSVIDIDWHLREVDPKYGSGWTGYTWNTELFPDYKAFLQWLHEKDLKVTLNVHPADGVAPYEVQYEKVCQRLGKDPQNEEMVEFDITDPAFVKAYFEELHHPYEEDGVDFWWVDWQQGTVSRVQGLDPLWPLNHFHYLDSARNGDRGLTFSRYAGLGSHRYPIGFSGDSFITWASLDFQPYFTSRAANVGYTWWSHDIGGHMEGSRDDELTVRWLQFGVFSPILRLHSSDNMFLNKEPWNFEPGAERAMCASLRLRHRLIPYIYTMNFRSTYENKALVRPLYFDYPRAQAAYEIRNEYFFGTELIACPITEPLNPKTKLARFQAWLPEGDFFDFFTGRHYTGEKRINLYRNIDATPVLAKAGAIVPLDNAVKLHNGVKNPANILLKVFTGQDGSFSLIEDDGLQLNPSKDDLAVTEYIFTFNDGTNSQLEISPVQGNLSVLPEQRNYEINLLGVDDTSVSANDPNCEIKAKTYDQQTRTLKFTIAALDPNKGVVLTFANTKIAANEYAQSSFALLDKMQIAYEVKREIYNKIMSKGMGAKVLSDLLANDRYEKDVIAPLAEIFLAAE